MKKYLAIALALAAGILVSSAIGCKTPVTVGVSYNHPDPDMKIEIKTSPFSAHSIVVEHCESQVFSR